MGFFVGVVKTDSGDLSAGTVERMRDIALHYGGGKPRLRLGQGFGLAQVSGVITPEDRFDRLPMDFAEGRFTLAFDGRLDNRDDILRDLRIGPERAASLGDGMLVAYALDRWEDEACRHLIGDFALAWRDNARRRLLLACDSDGSRTIYFHAGKDGLYFSTRPLALQGFPEVSRATVDCHSMAYLLLLRTLPADATYYRDIFRLPAAGRLIWTSDGHRIDRYWRPDWSRRIRFKHDDDYVAAGREVLDRAVAAQLRMVGPLVCQLSGGLDSPAVASTAARLTTPAQLHTITTTPDPAAPLPADTDRRVYDEWPLARQVAALYPNIIAHRAPAEALTPDEIDPVRLFQGFGQPIRNHLNFTGFRPGFDKARELGATVLLGGVSGNVTLTWQSMALSADLLIACRFAELARQMIGLRRNGSGISAFLRKQLIGPLIPPRARQLWQRFRDRPADFLERYSAISPAFAAELDVSSILHESWVTLDAPTFESRARQELLETNWSRRQFMAAHPYVSGCEIRDPLGDRRMVEFCLGLPPEQWSLGGVTRSFARRVLADRLPRAVYENRRRGFQSPDWFHRLSGLRTAMAEEIEQLEKSSTARYMLDLPRMRALLNDWPADAATATGRGLQTVLNRGLHFGRFIRWVESGSCFDELK